jgi:hypothetical protein
MSRFQKMPILIVTMIAKYNQGFHRLFGKNPGFCRVRWLIFILFLISQTALRAEPLVSPAWGFRIDLPECYEFSGGDGRNRFSFHGPEGTAVDIVVYPGGTYTSIEALAEDIQKRLGSRGEMSVFIYRDKRAVVIELEFAIPDTGQRPGKGGRTESFSGWGLCTELEKKDGGPPPLFTALAYGPAGEGILKTLAVSALDSAAPARRDEWAPGPMTEFAFPREAPRRVTLANSRASAVIDEIDARAAQALADREFEVLRYCSETPRWKEAWIRFYRMIYRDAWDRLADAAFALERSWHIRQDETDEDGLNSEVNRKTAARALSWVQSFVYERNFMGSDFVNPVSATLEGRGDCDSRALLWAVILGHANVPAAIMVSREYRHAMGLADLSGSGARFKIDHIKWLVAETTAHVSLGLIAAGNADPAKWIGVTFYSY